MCWYFEYRRKSVRHTLRQNRQGCGVGHVCGEVKPTGSLRGVESYFVWWFAGSKPRLYLAHCAGIVIEGGFRVFGLLLMCRFHTRFLLFERGIQEEKGKVVYNQYALISKPDEFVLGLLFVNLVPVGRCRFARTGSLVSLWENGLVSYMTTPLRM